MAGDCPDYGCVGFEPYEESVCGAIFLGGGSDVVIFNCGVTVTPTDGTAVNAAIAAGDAVLIKDVRVGIGAPSPVQVDSLLACIGQIDATYDYTLEYVDRNVRPANVDFYNSVKSSTGYVAGSMLVMECSTDRCTFIDAPMRSNVSRILPPTNTELQRFEGNWTFRSTSDPTIVTKPVGVFD